MPDDTPTPASQPDAAAASTTPSGTSVHDALATTAPARPRRRSTAAPSAGSLVRADALTFSALLDDLANVDDPWVLLDEVRRALESKRCGVAQRDQFCSQFFRLTAAKPASEQDALITAGAGVFQYRTQTARDEIKRLHRDGATGSKITHLIVRPEAIAELIHIPGTSPSVKWLMYRYDNETAEVWDDLQGEGITYYPPQSKLLEDGTVLLPSGVEEYGDQATLYRNISDFISSYLRVEDSRYQNLLTCYVFLTWIYDRFDVIPYLRAIGQFGSGKSRLLQVIGSLSYRPTFAGGATTSAPIFRIIDRYHGTLVLDEADFGESDLWSEVVKLLNCGFQKGFNVLRMGRTANEGFDIESFGCFGPKIMATRKRFADQALESRCFSYQTPPAVTLPKEIPFILDEEFRQGALLLRNKLLLWRLRRYFHTSLDPRERFEGLDNRLNQILLPLVNVAETDGMRQTLVGVAHSYQTILRQDMQQSLEGIVAAVFIERYRRSRFPGRVGIKEITDIAKSRYEGPLKVTYQSVGRVIRDEFHFKTSGAGGDSYAFASDREVDALVRNFSLTETPTSPPAQTSPSPLTMGALPPREPLRVTDSTGVEPPSQH